MKRDQEDIDRIAAGYKAGDFGHLKNLLAYRLNEQKGSFCLSGRPSDGVQIVSAVVKRGRVLVTADDDCGGGPPFRTFELKFEFVEQL